MSIEKRKKTLKNIDFLVVIKFIKLPIVIPLKLRYNEDTKKEKEETKYE